MTGTNGGTGVGRRLAAFVAEAPEAVFEVAPDGTVASWNAAAERLLGYSPDDVVGSDASRLLPPGTASFDGAAELVRADGTCVMVEVREVAGYVVARDLRPQRCQALVERTGTFFVICDPDGHVTYASPVGRTPAGREPGDLVGTNALDLVHESDIVNARTTLAASSLAPGTQPPLVVRTTDVAGRPLWQELTITNLIADPAVRGLAVAVRDVTAQRIAEDQLAAFAPVDRATGTLTRFALAREVAEARRTHPEAPSALVLVEVASVEDIRASHGYASADEVVRLVADRLRQTAGDDLVARAGGGTFLVLRRCVTGEEEALALADTLMSAVREPVAVGHTTRVLTASGGVTVSRSPDLETLVREANMARHRSALRGQRGVTTFVEGSDREVVRWLDAVSRLREGVVTDELRLHYQRCVRVSDGVTLGAEALVRWQRADGTLLAPADFLAAGEAAGAMATLGDWVLATACRDAATWRGDTFVSVNLSSAELARPDLADSVRDALRAGGLDASRLVVEIGEDAVLDPDEPVLQSIRALGDLGVRLAIDNFGTGYGSFRQLKRLPVATIKIGREFVDGLGRREDDDAIVASVLNLATGVGADVVAVGVESPEQHLALVHLGCHAAQGFLYGVPRPAAPDLEAFALPRGTTARRRPPRLHAHVDPVVVARVRTLVAGGASLATIAAALNADGLPHPKERRWHPRAVAHVVAELADDTAGRRSRERAGH